MNSFSALSEPKISWRGSQTLELLEAHPACAEKSSWTEVEYTPIFWLQPSWRA